MIIRSLFMMLFAFFLISFSAGAEVYQPQGDGGQVLPWPWGTECPFPWHNIEGMWTESEPKTESLPVTHFEFEIIDQWTNGTRVFRVTHYDDEGNTLAVGRGTAPSSQRIVRAVLLPSEMGGGSYTVIVRAYTEDRFACSDELVTVLTMRKRGAIPEEDIHLIIGKSAEAGLDN